MTIEPPNQKLLPALMALAAALAASMLAGVPGCAARRAARADATAERSESAGAAGLTNPTPFDADQYARIFDAAAHALRDEGYMIDRLDYRFGVITTKPEPAPLLFEIWRSGNTSFSQTLSSTINDEQRVVSVFLEPLDNKAQGEGDNANSTHGRYQLRVEVVIERRQRPTRHLTGGLRGNEAFTSLRELPIEYERRGIAIEYWRPMRRDTTVEAHILRAVLRRADKES